MTYDVITNEDFAEISPAAVGRLESLCATAWTYQGMVEEF